MKTAVLTENLHCTIIERIVVYLYPQDSTKNNVSCEYSHLSIMLTFQEIKIKTSERSNRYLGCHATLVCGEKRCVTAQ